MLIYIPNTLKKLQKKKKYFSLERQSLKSLSLFPLLCCEIEKSGESVGGI